MLGLEDGLRVDAVHKGSTELTRLSEPTGEIQPRAQHRGFLESVTWMDGFGSVRDVSGYGQSVMKMGGETTAEYPKGSPAELLTSCAPVVDERVD